MLPPTAAWILLGAALGALAACRAGDAAPEPPAPAPAAERAAPGPQAAPTPDAAPAFDLDADPWAADFTPPLGLETARLRLEPLAPRHAALDFAALMGSREHLQRTLRWGDWPRADFTLEENRADLERHRDEFERREAYAYTVLTPDGARCVGCIYLEPMPAGAGLPQGLRAARLAFWVVEDQLASGLDRHLVETLVGWFGARWPLDLVACFPLADDAHGAALLADAGLVELDAPRPTVRLFVWEAD